MIAFGKICNNLIKKSIKNLKSHCIIISLVFVIYVYSQIIVVLINLFVLRSKGVQPVNECHYVKHGNVLPLADDKFNPPENSIFFLETSCKGDLDSRQACAIESAARAHPRWRIHVFFSSSINETFFKTPLKDLRNLINVRFNRVHVVEFAELTPLKHLVGNGALNRTKWPVSHTSDVLRYLTLYKWGGVYLDLDVVVAKSFESLAKNFAAKESADTIAAGVLSFSRDEIGRYVSEAAVADLNEHFNGNVWGQNGPNVIYRVVQQMCKVATVEEINAFSCKGFEVYNLKYFYPIHWNKWIKYFEPGNLTDEPYMYHVWNHKSRSCKVSELSLYAKLAKKYCPKIYDIYGTRFGE